MDKKKIIVLLVITNLFFVFCIVFLLVSNKKGNIPAPAVTADVTSAVSKDANSQSQNSKTPVKPEDIIACFDTGKKERRQKAIEDYGQIMRSEPPYVGELTEVYNNAKNAQWDKALALCNHLIQYGEDKREALYSLAWIYAKQGRYKDAIKTLDESISNYPEFVKFYVLLGWIHAKEGRYDEAMSVSKNIIKIAPDNAIGYYGLGRLYAVMDKPTEAIASYSDAIRVKPDFAEAHFFLGLIYCQQGRWADAVKAFNDTINFKRYNEQTYLFQAVAYDALGLYKEASEDIIHAIELSRSRSNVNQDWYIFEIEPDYARYNCALAEIYVRLGEYYKAVLACQDAIAINPVFSEAYYDMALAYLLLGDKDSALKQRDKLISLKANDMAAKLDELMKK